jgi:hypothetical protein
VDNICFFVAEGYMHLLQNEITIGAVFRVFRRKTPQLTLRHDALQTDLQEMGITSACALRLLLQGALILIDSHRNEQIRNQLSSSEFATYQALSQELPYSKLFPKVPPNSTFGRVGKLISDRQPLILYVIYLNFLCNKPLWKLLGALRVKWKQSTSLTAASKEATRFLQDRARLFLEVPPSETETESMSTAAEEEEEVEIAEAVLPESPLEAPALIQPVSACPYRFIVYDLFKFPGPTKCAECLMPIGSGSGIQCNSCVRDVGEHAFVFHASCIHGRSYIPVHFEWPEEIVSQYEERMHASQGHLILDSSVCHGCENLLVEGDLVWTCPQCFLLTYHVGCLSSNHLLII